MEIVSRGCSFWFLLFLVLTEQLIEKLDYTSLLDKKTEMEMILDIESNFGQISYRSLKRTIYCSYGLEGVKRPCAALLT